MVECDIGVLCDADDDTADVDPEDSGDNKCKQAVFST